MALLCTSCAILERKGNSHETGDLDTMAARFTKVLAVSASPLEQQSIALHQAVARVKAVNVAEQGNRGRYGEVVCC
jgi:hypothetical protein